MSYLTQECVVSLCQLQSRLVRFGVVRLRHQLDRFLGERLHVLGQTCRHLQNDENFMLLVITIQVVTPAAIDNIYLSLNSSIFPHLFNERPHRVHDITLARVLERDVLDKW